MVRLNLLGRVRLTEGETGSLLALAPKPLSLLAYLSLAAGDGTPVRRDTLVALFWPELTDTRARNALRQAVFQIRRVVGDGVIPPDVDDAIRLDPNLLGCDAVAFEVAYRQGALELYRGDLLDGFYCSGLAAELEEWFERRRARLKASA